MSKFIRNLAAYIGFEALELVATVLGFIAIGLFFVATWATFMLLRDSLSNLVNIVVSCGAGLLLAAVPAYLSVRLGKLAE